MSSSTVTVKTLLAMKRRGEKIAMLTAYDYHSARVADAGGIDVILVGDTLGMVVQGHENTLPVTVDDVVYHSRMVRRADPRALVIGDGKLGLLVAMVLQSLVRDLVLTGRHANKLAIAARAGVRTTPASEMAERDFDLVVECAGRAEGFAEALARVRPLGTIVLKSTVAGETCAALSAAVVNEVTVVGSRCGPFEPALSALASGRPPRSIASKP